MGVGKTTLVVWRLGDWTTASDRLFNLIADCIVKFIQKICPRTLEPLVGSGCFRHCP